MASLLLQAIGAAPGFCMQCKTERATRICDQCTFGRRQKVSWGGGKYHLCFVCFAVRQKDVQAGGRALRACLAIDGPAVYPLGHSVKIP